MQSIVFLVVALTVLALASAEVSAQAKKAKVVSKSSGNSFLNVWYYGDSACTGPVGLAASLANNACDNFNCNRRALADVKNTKYSTLNPAAALAEIFPKFNKKAAVAAHTGKATGNKLQAGPNSFQLNFNQNTFGGVQVANAVSSFYTDNSCTNWFYDAPTEQFSFNSLTTAYPLNTCIGGADGKPFKITVSSEPMVPSYDNGFVAIGSFETDAQCDNTAYGKKVSAANGFQIYFYYPIGMCSHRGEIVSITSSGGIQYDDYENRDCSGAKTLQPAVPAGTCQVGGVEADFLSGCGSLRADVVDKKAKKNSPSANLRL